MNVRSSFVNTENFSIDENWLVRESWKAKSASQPLSDLLVIQAKEMIEAALAESEGRESGRLDAAGKFGIPLSIMESEIKSPKIKKHLFKIA